MRDRTVLFLAAMLLFAGCETKQTEPRVVTGLSSRQGAAQLARAEIGAARPTGQIDPVALFSGPMPTGVAVSHDGRIFVCFPRWGDPVQFTVAEIINGNAVPYPDLALNKFNPDKAADCLVSVQSVVVDAKNRLWVLDTGSINMEPIYSGGPKLLCYDLKTNQLVKRIEFPNTALSTTYLNDVRFDLNLGKEGMAFITDSSDKGPNAIIVVDLATGENWRRLEGDPSTIADSKFIPVVEGQPLLVRPKDQPTAYMQNGTDGIAISPDGKTLYYSPLASHRLYSVSTAALVDRNAINANVAATIRPLPSRDYASDGLECDTQGRLYLTDYEHNAIHRRNADGSGDQIIAQDPRMIWPDSMAIGPDGYLYFTCNQLDRMSRFHEGKDLRQQPYVLLRSRIEDGATN